MTQRTINGLVYDIISPSHWQLKGFPVELCYLGDAWFIFLTRNGETKSDKLTSREDGLQLIAKALHRENA